MGTSGNNTTPTLLRTANTVFARKRQSLRSSSFTLRVLLILPRFLVRRFLSSSLVVVETFFRSSTFVCASSGGRRPLRVA